MNKLYKVGMFSGRMQHIHKIHEFIINNGLQLCEKVVIFIGQPHKSRTLDNPFTWQERKDFIEKIYKNEIKKSRIIVYPLEEFTGKIQDWCKYASSKVESLCGVKPNVILEGRDKRDIPFFKNEDMVGLTELVVSEQVLSEGKERIIRGTQVREFLLNGDFKNWSECTNSILYEEYDKMRRIIKECVK